MPEKTLELKVNHIKIRGKIFSPNQIPSKPKAVVILHGIPRTKPAPGDPGYKPLAQELAGLGFLTVFLNLRGCGESEGNFSILGWTKDLKACLNWLEQNYSPAGIALAGFSGGAAVAIYTAAHDRRVSAVVSASSPANFDALGMKGQVESWLKNFRAIGLFRDPRFPRSLPKWLAEFEELKPLNWVDKISPRPLLLLHGEKDELVPLGQARKLYGRAGEPKELFVVKNAPHRLRLEPEAIRRIKDWLLSRMPPGK